MKRYFVFFLLLISLLLVHLSCKSVKEEIGKAKKVFKNVKKVADQVKAANSDNPLKIAKVGDYIKFRMTTQTMGSKIQMEMKQTVIAKDDVSITLRTETTASGIKMPPQDSRIMLNQPYEPYKQGFPDAIVTPIGEGSETLNVGGKSYNCKWVKVKVVSLKPTPIEAVTTVWSSSDVPVTGMVKMVTSSTTNLSGNKMTTKMTMDLLEAKN
mgnify:FL=1